MTPDQYNKLLAENVMGWTATGGGYKGYEGADMFWIHAIDFDPYHDERDCHRALEVMRKKGWNWVIEASSTRQFTASLWRYRTDKEPYVCFQLEDAPTFTAAACEAMLKAVEGSTHNDDHGFEDGSGPADPANSPD